MTGYVRTVRRGRAMLNVFLALSFYLVLPIVVAAALASKGGDRIWLQALIVGELTSVAIVFLLSRFAGRL